MKAEVGKTQKTKIRGKRTKWPKPEPVSEEVVQLFGENTFPEIGLFDRAFWLEADYDEQTWISAIERVDKTGDNSALIDLFKSDRPLSKQCRLFIADFLNRYSFRKKRGGQRTPAYDRSTTEALIELAVEDVRYHKVQGQSESDALEAVAKKFGMPVQTLANALGGRRGSTRRIKKAAHE